MTEQLPLSLLLQNFENSYESESFICLFVTPNSPGQNTGGGSVSLLQGIFPTQVSNPGLPHGRRILYQLTHQGNPRTLE